MQKDTLIALGFCGVILGLLVVGSVLRGSGNVENVAAQSSVVRTEDGMQIIDLTAKGGYSPRRIRATAGLPTELRVATNGTFDCSSSLVIPSLGYQKLLEPTGVETIVIAEADAQGTLEGSCSMGMYDFEIAFM